MSKVVHDFHLGLILYSSMACLVKEGKGQVQVDFDGLTEAHTFKDALDAAIQWTGSFAGDRQGNLLDTMLACRLHAYHFERTLLPPIPGFEEEVAIRWRFVWTMENPHTANELYLRLQWMLDKDAFIV